MNIKKIFFHITVILPVLFLQCTPSELKILSHEVGSNLSGDGSISNSSLNYKFKKYKKNRQVKDLFNYLYFKGDTLCFSFKINKEIMKDKIKAWFINPGNNDIFPVERIDVDDDRISGFSLVGSIMESFFSDQLRKPVPTDSFCCKDIPFKIRIEIEDKKIIKTEVSSFFKIEFTN